MSQDVVFSSGKIDHPQKFHDTVRRWKKKETEMSHLPDGFIWFVDFDGVNCTTRANMVQGRFDDPIAFGLLKIILERTNSLMVISSTRRGNADMGVANNCLDMLARHGLRHLLHPDWRTGNFGSRSLEVSDWLDRNGMRPYGILDDERCDFTPAQLQRLIHTDMMFGLGSHDVGKACRLADTAMDAVPVPDEDDAPYQSPRITIANQARQALAALDQGDEESVRRLLSIIAEHPLAQ